MMADPQRGRKLIVEFTGLDPTIVEKMVYSRYNYEVIPEKWQQVIQIMTNSKILEKPHTPDEFFSDPVKVFIHK
jgi:hypothetical protein